MTTQHSKNLGFAATALLAAALLILPQNTLAQTNADEQVDARTGATRVEEAPAQTAIAKQDEGEEYQKFRVGGYGEMLASFLNYGKNRFYGGLDNSDTRRTIAIPRFVIAADYKFTPKWNLGMEIEFEAGGIGMEQELEKTENLEYETEMEQGGEVALEQFHITRFIVPGFNIRAGHQIVPLGLTNSHHEPVFFFGTSRPEGETTIIPSTWHETGISFFGNFGARAARFDYEVQVVTGLNPDGFGRDNWVGGGKQGLFEVDCFTSPAYVGRINWNGIRGLRVGVSGYYCKDVTENSDKPYKYSSCGESAVKIFSADAQYVGRAVTVRANVITGDLENAGKIGAVTLSNNSSYHHGAERPVAKKALAYGVEVGANLKGIFYNGRRGPVFFPFARYEYYNPQQEPDEGKTVDVRCQVAKWTWGLNWFALPNLVVKADYTTRHIGTDNPFKTTDYAPENEFSIGIAYCGWFFKK